MSERGIPFDIGCKKLDVLSAPDKISSVQTNEEGENEYQEYADPKLSYLNDRGGRGHWRGNRSRGSGNKPVRVNCFIWKKGGHYAADCYNQYCQLCGKFGHGLKKCSNPPPGLKTFSPAESNKPGFPLQQGVAEDTVIIDIKVNGADWEAMIDSGAALCVTDVATLKQLNLD